MSGQKKIDVEKVDIQNIYKSEHPDLYEHLVLDLSRAIHQYVHKSEGCAISWKAQVEASDYFNAHGFEKTLAYFTSLGDAEREET